MSNRECSYKVSLEGLKIVDQFRLQKGWKKIDSQWLNRANVSRSTLKRFWNGNHLQPDTFTGICRAVGIEDYDCVAEAPNSFRSIEHDQRQAFFVTDSPIHRPQLFFGRHYEIRHILQLLSGYPLQNAAIVGQRRSGKTSLLKHLVEITKVPGQALRPNQPPECRSFPTQLNWILIDFQNIYYQSLKNLVHYLLVKMGLPSNGETQLEDCIQLMSERLSVPTVILFDEIESAFHQQSELDDRFWNSLRFLQQNNGNLAFVLSSSTDLKHFARKNIESSSFFDIFGYQATLGPLTEAEARQLILTSPIPFSRDDIDYILTYSQCWPVLVQLFCRERLFTLEAGDNSDSWRVTVLQHMHTYRHLLNEDYS